VEFGQGYANMSAPTKSFLQNTVEKKFMTGGNEALRAQLNNTSVTTDASGNIKPDKAKSSSRIDGVIATIMGLDGLNRRGGPSKLSAYEQPFADEQPAEETLDTEPQMAEQTSTRQRQSAYEVEDEE
jgi:hypothetical protein